MISADDSSLVDVHNHLVPGVDDGAKHVPAVLASVERFMAVGIRRIITTPHIRASLTLEPEPYEVRLSHVDAAFEEASRALGEQFPEFEYKRGHEVLLDVPEPDFSDQRIRMGGTSFVLVEWPRLTIPPGTPRVLSWLRDQGYRPIVAHPERYGGMAGSGDLPRRWRDAGAYLQVNYGSLAGRYGAQAEEIAVELLEDGLVDYLSSDFHGHSSLKIYKTEAWDVLEERDATVTLDVLCRTNPARLLDDLEPLPAPPVPPAPLLGRLRGIIGRRRRTEERSE